MRTPGKPCKTARTYAIQDISHTWSKGHGAESQNPVGTEEHMKLYWTTEYTEQLLYQSYQQY